MKHRILALAFAFVAALVLSAIVESAEARRGRGGGSGHHSSFRSHSAPRIHSYHHRHSGIRYVPMAPRHFQRNYFYSGSRYAGDGCAWLRHRALATGSRYWWQRYQACRTGAFY